MDAPITVSPGAEEVARRIAAGEARVAAEIIAPLARRTPMLSSRGLSDACGGQVVLKAENLQRTGSFKLRGAAHRPRTAERPDGPSSPAARATTDSRSPTPREPAGVPCEVFMPREAPVAKVAAVQAFGGVVDLSAESVDEAVAKGAGARSADRRRLRAPVRPP